MSGLGLFGADPAGGDGEVNMLVEAEAAGELIAVSVHVGDDAEGEAEGAEALEVGEDVVEEDHAVGDLADALPDAGGEGKVDGGAGRLEDEELVACEEVGAGFRGAEAEGEGAGVLPGHERVGEGVAFGDALVRDVETKVAGGGGLELLAGGPEVGERPEQIEEERLKVRQRSCVRHADILQPTTWQGRRQRGHDLDSPP